MASVSSPWPLMVSTTPSPQRSWTTVSPSATEGMSRLGGGDGAHEPVGGTSTFPLPGRPTTV